MASLGRLLLQTTSRLAREKSIIHSGKYSLYTFRKQYQLASQVSGISSIHTCTHCRQENDIPTGAGISRLQRNALVLSKSLFEEGSQQTRNKEAFKDIVQTFTELDKRRRGHVQFIETALRYMKLFGVEKDIDAYNRLLDVFPKDKYVARNAYQSMFNHYPEQQTCGIKVLQQMEDNAVLPNNETKEILISVFGKKAHPVRKYQRLMYWFPKFRNINPFPLPKEMPTDPIKLCELGLKRISEYEANFSVFSADGSLEMSVTRKDHDFSEFQGRDFIASVQSPDQQEELAQHQVYRPLFVEGPYTLWLRTHKQTYYVLRADPLDLYDPIYDRGELPPAPMEGNVYALCMTNNGSMETLNEWVRKLQESNPHLARLNVIFNLFDQKGDGAESETVHHIGEGTKMLES
ncbi:evolutionarily conserved signaling intermediate in Toll pathway, mitochondrial-like [Diadema antillarum]|uniref:evolutionarily conserved signaling intermediate in Toll pathway, mitochondrial-like n=1 Tax=Diadema antillarum TaxID=105358 RepID=UPI003A8B50A7